MSILYLVGGFVAGLFIPSSLKTTLINLVVALKNKIFPPKS